VSECRRRRTPMTCQPHPICLAVPVRRSRVRVCESEDWHIIKEVKKGFGSALADRRNLRIGLARSTCNLWNAVRRGWFRRLHHSLTDGPFSDSNHRASYPSHRKNQTSGSRGCHARLREWTQIGHNAKGARVAGRCKSKTPLVAGAGSNRRPWGY
jgi:hypothetical protein